jgi:hypothetical protein
VYVPTFWRIGIDFLPEKSYITAKLHGVTSNNTTVLFIHSPKYNVRLLLYLVLPDIRKSLKFSKLRPLVLPMPAVLRWWWRCVWSISGMIMTEENRSTRSETFPTATLSTTKFTRTSPESKTVLRVETVATNRLSHGTTLKPAVRPNMFKKITSCLTENTASPYNDPLASAACWNNHG